jgi:hypothetical protein
MGQGISMTRGTTRQILADIERRRTELSPVQITRSSDADTAGLVQITVAHPPEMRRGAVKGAMLFGAIFGGFALLFGSMAIVKALIVFGWLGVASVIVSLVSYDRAARAYVFRVGRDRVVVASSGPFGPRYWEIDSAKVRDVRLMEGRSRYVLFDLAGGFGNRKGFVLDLPREEFMKLIDAVREGLGMPKHEWK